MPVGAGWNLPAFGLAGVLFISFASPAVAAEALPPPGRPDLAIVSFTLDRAWSTDTPCHPGVPAYDFAPCGALLLTAIVENRGDEVVVAENLTVLFKVHGLATWARFAPLPGPIPPGGASVASAFLDLGPCDPARCSPPFVLRYTFEATADPENFVTEADETNNAWPEPLAACAHCP